MIKLSRYTINLEKIIERSKKKIDEYENRSSPDFFNAVSNSHVDSKILEQNKRLARHEVEIQNSKKRYPCKLNFQG